MSVSIHVQINQPMSLADLAAATSARALRELLSVEQSVTIVAAFESNGSNANRADCLTDGAQLVICSVAQREEAVRVMPFKVPWYERLTTGEWSFQGDPLLASIECHTSRSPLCWALVAAVAVAIARVLHRLKLRIARLSF